MPKRIEIQKPGKHSVLKVRPFENPSISLDKYEVKIDVHFSGINFADLLIRKGLYSGAPTYPLVPGFEVSGKVLQIGSEVKHLQIGQKVIAGCHFGGYSSEVDLPAHLVLPLPEEFDLKQGASFLVSYFTAYLALVELGNAQKGQSVLIDCISGSLGQTSIQILKKLEANIYGLTSSPEKKDYFKKRGIQTYLNQEFPNEVPHKFDLILNSRGSQYASTYLEKLRPLGKIIYLGHSSLLSKNKDRFKEILSLFTRRQEIPQTTLIKENKGILGLNVLDFFSSPAKYLEIFEKMKRFNLTPIVSKSFSYTEVVSAHKYIENKKSMGKVLLNWKI